jgi:aspartokinase
MTWTVHLLEEGALDASDGGGAFVRALAAGEGRHCVVAAPPAEDVSELAAMIDLARARDDRYRTRLDALGARRGEDVRDLADILHAVRTVGFREATRDLVLAYASLWAAGRLAERLTALGLDVVALDGRDLLVAHPDPDEGDLRVEWDASREATGGVLGGVSARVVVVAGALFAAPDDATVTVTAAGGDHSAGALAVLVGAREVVRWTHGEALAVGEITYATAAVLGADVHPALQPAAWKPLVEHGLTLELRPLAGGESTFVRTALRKPPVRPVAAFGVVAPVTLFRAVGRSVGRSARMFRSVFAALGDLGVAPLALCLPTGTGELVLAVHARDADAVAAKLAHALLWEGRGRVAQEVARVDACALVRVALHEGAPPVLGELLGVLAREGVAPLVSAHGASPGAGLVLAEKDLARAKTALDEAFVR